MKQPFGGIHHDASPALPIGLLPERRLLAAMLSRAADDLQYQSGSLDYADAYCWIMDPSFEPGGFGWACAGLGMDAAAVKTALLGGRCEPAVGHLRGYHMVMLDR